MLPKWVESNGGKIILASTSPRRQELLSGLGIPYEIRTKNIDEDYPHDMPPEEIPVYLSKKKAAAFKDEIANHEILITADTVVCIGNTVLNKPQNRAEAIEMIQSLNANTHKVVTGVCVTSTKKQLSFSDTTLVKFSNLSQEEIAWYVDTYKPYDKAGAYGIQEWIGYAGIETIEGSFYTVMGLPTQKLYVALKKIIAL